MTQVKQASVAINTYLGNVPTTKCRANRTQVYSHVIRVAEGYNKEASGEANPSHTEAPQPAQNLL